MGDLKLKFTDGNLRWITGSGLGFHPQDGENPKAFQVGTGLSLVGLAPKQLGFVYAAPNYTQTGDQKQVGILFGGGIDLLLSTVSVGVNPGINLNTGGFTLGAEITMGPLIGLNKDWSILPAFKMSWPDLLAGAPQDSIFYGFQLSLIYGHLPDE